MDALIVLGLRIFADVVAVLIGKDRSTRVAWDQKTATRKMWWGITAVVVIELGNFIGTFAVPRYEGIGVFGWLAYIGAYLIAAAFYRKRYLRKQKPAATGNAAAATPTQTTIASPKPTTPPAAAPTSPSPIRQFHARYLDSIIERMRQPKG